jgi:hypothetical protein
MNTDFQPIQPSDTVHEILSKMCSCNGNEITLHYPIFKAIANEATYPAIIHHVYEVSKKALTFSPKIIVHANLKSTSVGSIDTHKQFIMKLIERMSVDFSDALDKCYLYKTPFAFSQIYNIICIALDKETKQKIQIVKTP